MPGEAPMGHAAPLAADDGGVPEAGTAASVEHRLRRLLGAATSRFDQMRSDMREMAHFKEQHDALLGGLEQLLQVWHRPKFLAWRQMYCVLPASLTGCVTSADAQGARRFAGDETSRRKPVAVALRLARGQRGQVSGCGRRRSQALNRKPDRYQRASRSNRQYALARRSGPQQLRRGIRVLFPASRRIREYSHVFDRAQHADPRGIQAPGVGHEDARAGVPPRLSGNLFVKTIVVRV